LRCTRGAIMVHSCVNVLIGTLVLHTFGRRESSAPILPFKYTPVPCCPRETFSWVYIFLLIFGRRWSTATTTLVESTRVPCYSVWTFLWGTFIFVSTRNMIMESVHQDGNMIAQRCHNECTESQGWARDSIDGRCSVPSRVRRDFVVFHHRPSGPSRPVKVRIHRSVPFLSRQIIKFWAFFQVIFTIWNFPPLKSSLKFVRYASVACAIFHWKWCEKNKKRDDFTGHNFQNIKPVPSRE